MDNPPSITQLISRKRFIEKAEFRLELFGLIFASIVFAGVVGEAYSDNPRFLHSASILVSYGVGGEVLIAFLILLVSAISKKTQHAIDRETKISSEDRHQKLKNQLDAANKSLEEISNPSIAISVSPTESILFASGWSAEPIIRVTNNTDYPLYAVQVMADLEGVPLGTNTGFDYLSHHPEELITVGNLVIDASKGIQLGFTDGSGCLQIPAINPRETVTLKLHHDIKQDCPNDASVQFRIASYTDVPRPSLSVRPAPPQLPPQTPPSAMP